MDYSIKINDFEGPLDLLLHLIKQSNISIYDIEINEITKQYLDYIKRMEELNINVAASYLVMAAELMEIKSKSLIPIVSEDAEVLEDGEEVVSKEGLINKLVEYQKYKDMGNKFRELELDRQNIYIKSPEKISNYVEQTTVNDNDISVDELVDAFLKFLERKEREKPLTTKIMIKEYSVKERKISIRNILKEQKKVSFTTLIDENNISFIVTTFLSILELTKEKEVVINQDGNFGDITVELKVLK